MEGESEKPKLPSPGLIELAQRMVNTGVYTVNEVRAVLGLNPVPGGQELTTST